MSARGDDKNRLKAVLRAANAHTAKPRADFDNEQIEKTYARWAPFYDPAFAQILRWGRAAAVASANRHIGGRVLDVGVGTGLELPMFGRSLKVIGVDLSEPMLRRAARRVRQADLRQVAGLARMDACRLAFEDARFDLHLQRHGIQAFDRLFDLGPLRRAATHHQLVVGVHRGDTHAFVGRDRACM